MADVVKKKKNSRRLKRSVRRTLGTLFLVSALAVASIPTEGLGREVQAYTSSAQASYKSKLTWDEVTNKGATSKIPLVPEGYKDIYSDEDGLFYFAWYNDEAIILEYTGKELAGGALTIPDTVDAYAQMSANAGATTGYVAISRNHEVLYYMSSPYKVSTEDKKVSVKDASGNEIKDENGNVVTTTKTVFTEYQLPNFSFCSRDDSTWKVDDITTTYLSNEFYYRYDMKLDSAGNPTENFVDEADLYTTDADGDKILKPDYEAIISSIGIFKGGDSNFYKKSGPETSHQWICNQSVRYIGNQYLVNKTNSSSTSADVQIVQTKEVATDSTTGKAFVNENPEHGVFNNKGNVTTLTVGNQLIGIGNYAFYNCGGLTSIKLGNGLLEIGHDAFAYCDTLYLVDIPYNCNLTHIYDCAFAYSGLNTFALPQPVQYICDSAFEGCSKLVEINLANIDLQYTKQQTFFNTTTGQNDASEPRLSQIGCSVFKGCNFLKEITFPTKLSSDIHLDNFQNCSSLARITMLGTNAGFMGHADGTVTYSVVDFKAEGNVSPDIYFESYGTSKTHDFTKENVIAFKYIDDVQQYEIILIEKGTDGSDVKLTYQVDESSSLYSFEMNGKVSKVEIPTKIGPKYINTISAGSFADTCHLTKIIIPASIKSIGDNAFKGCHNLRHVIYDDSSAVSSIGADAFRTQVMMEGHYQTSSGKSCDGGTSNNPSLSFTGLIATNNGAGNITEPFAYAMNPANTISNQNQADTYITYYSGWPTLLEVKYEPKSGKSRLVDYPTVWDLKNGTYIDKDTNGEYKYPFMDSDYVEAITAALQVYYNINLGGGGNTEETGYAAALNNAILNIVLPYGVESIEPNLFVGKEAKEIGPGGNTDSKVQKQLTAYGLKEVEDGAFKGFKNLTTVNLADSTIELGSYAFDGCESLTTAVLPMTLKKLGLRPFKDCKSLSSVSLSGSPKFTVSDGIIYELDESGNKYAVVECLGMRTGGVSKTEMAGVQTLYPEAFMGSQVGSVNLSSSYISKVPAFAFAYTGNLYSVTLPSTVEYIDPNGFKNSSISELYIPNISTQVDNLALGDGIYGDENNPDQAKNFWKSTHSYTSEEAAEADGVGVWTDEEKYGFSHTTKSELSKPTDLTRLTIYCEDDSMAKKNFADRYHIKTSNDFDKSYVVNFYDEDGVTKLIDTQTVERNEGAVQPDMTGEAGMKPDGRVFVQWQPTWADPNCIVADTNFTAYFADPLTEYCTITFWKDYTYTESFGTAQVVKGTTRTELEASGQIPTERVEAYAFSIDRKFLAWVSMPEVINEDANPYAQYDALSWTVTFVDKDDPETVFGVQKVLNGENAQDFIPTKEGYDFDGWLDPLDNITKDTTIRGLFLKSSLTVRHKVTFYDYDGSVYKEQNVPDGEDATEPTPPTREGYTFIGWQPAEKLLKVTKDVDVTATYEKDGNGDNNGANTHTVTFYDYDGKVYKTQKVIDGEDAVEPAPPTREGYTFTGWQPAEKLLKVTKDVDVMATYDNKASGNNSNGNGNTTSGNTASGNTASGNSSRTYILTVQNGSGSGSYPAGSQPVIIANDPSAGYEFSHWTIAPENTAIASTVLSASVITMPAANVTVTANYKVKTGSSGSSTGTGNTSNTNYNRPNGTTGTVTNGGTTVVIDKNGLSNTGVVSAVVNGSSDNFTIKISESSEATEAVLRALVAEYGNDLNNIKYFPMDISLYNAAGDTKITDTTGLRISITLPLPDSLIPYAGNNKVAGVVNDRLDKLSPRFTTIDGVSCVTFTAEHFSPYVIYVDISRLSDGTVADSTPKTGDGIHPKWFLSIGLACLSFVMFMQKDNKKKQKVKAKVKARS